MTNQEAISVLESINAKTDYFLINDDARAEAIDMAISALQAQDVPDTNVGDMVSRQAAIDALCRRCDLAAEDDEPCTEKCNDIKILEKLPSAQSQRCSDIMDELKDDDYYNYIHTGHSRFSEDDWDYLIYNAKEKEKLHERLDIKTGGD